MNLDAAPSFMNRVATLGIIVASARGNRHDLMPRLRETQGQVCQMLCRRDMVRIETLIEKQNPHA
jgi:hypothetical protein